MNLQFILGRAGTGKTHHCLNGITKELEKSPKGAPLIFLVPEQATLLAEMSLFSYSDIKGIMRAEILSFQRMTYRVLDEVGGSAKTHLGDLGKKMLIRRLLQKYKDRLKAFQLVADKPGFIENLDRTFEEFKSYMISVDDLKEVYERYELSKQSKILKDKLHDLIILYSEFHDIVSDKYVENSNYLDLLAQKIRHWHFLDGAKVWIDGFTGFTPQEYMVIEEIMKKVNEFNITLCMDGTSLNEKVDENNPFYRLRETMENVLSIGEKINATIKKPKILDPSVPHRYKDSLPIAHLEREFFDHPPNIYNEKQDNIKVYVAADRRAEVEGVIREIVRLCRDKGYRYKDIYILLRDLEPYRQLISAVFTDNDIPFFLDQKRSVMHHPLAELIRSALEVISRNWAYDAIFRYLKTDLVDIKREDVDLLENYVLAYGIKGYKWVDNEPWTYQKRYTLGDESEKTSEYSVELERINKIRDKAIKELRVFYETIKKTSTVRGYTKAIYQLLFDLNVPEKIENWELEAYENGNLDLALEHSQIWDSIVDMTDEIVLGLGDEEISIEEYSEVLESGLQSIRLGLLPLGMDQVVIGDLDRSRNPNVKVVFIMGANDGVLPLRHIDEGTLTDKERQDLSKHRIKLAPDSRSRLFDEQYYIYVALTRASDFLYISYPLADEEGGALIPSYIIRQVKRIFPFINENRWDVEPQGDDTDINYIHNIKGGLTHLPQQLRTAAEGKRINPIWWDVYTWLVTNGKSKHMKKLNGIFYVNQEVGISKGLSKRLFSNPIIASVSQLERYQRCPFSHFISHGIRLKERPIYKLGAPDLGQFFHASMDMITRRLLNDSIDLADLNDNECKKITSEVVGELAPQLQNEILMSTARHKYLTGRLKKTVERAVLTLRDHAKRGSFRPVGFELAFGDNANLPPLEIELTDKGDYIKLRGRIDRVDKAVYDDKIYLRVIDYKSGLDDFELEDIYYGLSLQLLVYLEVVLQYSDQLLGKEGIPGGIFHFKIDNPIITKPGPEKQEIIEEEIIKRLRMKGLMTADSQLVKLMDNSVTSGYST